jgi:hypothetical protein
MDLTRDEKVEQLDRLLASRTLHGSESLKGFLRFVVTRAIDNGEGSLKEYIIATEVFGRSSNYDSRNDSVVRVQAGRLRSKLQEYYSTEGKDDSILIELPKGHYTPTFSSLKEKNGESGSETLAAAPHIEIAAPPVLGNTRNTFVIGGLILFSLTLAYFAFNYRSEAQGLRHAFGPRGVEAEDLKIITPVWGDFLRSSKPTLVTFSNTLFQGTAETGMKLLKPLDSDDPSADPSALSNTAAAAAKAGGQAVTEHYTGVGEVMGIYALGDFFYGLGHSIRVKRSLMLNWDDLKAEDIVFLGSPAENLLLRSLPQQQDFVFKLIENDKQASSYGVVNTKPKTGEQSVYLAKQEGPSRSQVSEDYAVISFLRGLDPRYRLMILAGITTYGTQAAAEYVTKPEYIQDMISHLSTSSGDSPTLPSFYQVLIKVKVNGGVPVQISYVTHHVL